MGLLRLRTDLPLASDASGRFVPWIVGFMVYLAALALAGALTLENVAARWRAGITGTLTVQIAPIDADFADSPAGEEPAAGEAAAAHEARLDRAVDLLRATPGVAGVEVLGPDAMGRLLSPWLGPDTATLGLPIPDLISVTLRPGAQVDLPALSAALAEAVPGAAVDDHRRWLDDLSVFVRSVELLAAVVVTLVCLAAMLTVVFVTRTGLAVHRRVIEIVHMIGARDAYIAGQFQGHALRLGLIGGLVGSALAALTVIGLQNLFAGLDTPLLRGLGLGAAHWAVLAILPVAAALVAMATARVTVLRSLRRMGQ
jgi:cell division transport system permease protein